MRLSNNDEKSSYEGLPVSLDKKLGVPVWNDVRELKLRYRMSLGKIKKFFSALSEGKIMATKCKHCGRIYFPPQADCPYCMRSDMEWVDVPNEGVLETFTIVNIKPTTFSHYDDYVLAIARFGDGIKVLAWLRVDEKSRVRIGMRVKLTVIKRIPEGYYTFELEPID